VAPEEEPRSGPPPAPAKDPVAAIVERARGERDETDLERLDRNLIELMQELRVVQTGVQVLFAFLLTVPFSQRFEQITGFQRGVYFAALVGTAVAAVLLIAPTALHRVLFRLGQKDYMIERSNQFALGGLVATAVAMIAAMLLVSDVMFGMGVAIAVGAVTAVAFVAVWAVLPLRRRRAVVGGRAGMRRR
jgi:uncharacterized protein DUF6328